MTRWLLAIALCLAGLTAAPSAGSAETPMTFTYSEGQSEIGQAKRFHWTVLEAALERTRKSHGDYRLAALPSMPMSRQQYELTHDHSTITVAAFNSNAERAGWMLPVRIPIDAGLLSYRVLLIREKDQPEFDRIKSLDDLKSLRFGLMPWWDDARIMRTAGATVVDGDSFDGLFHMLSANRFDALSRGVSEVMRDLERMRPQHPELAVEKHLLLHYPLPVYFWFSPDEEGRARAARVSAGLTEMAADGTLKAMILTRYADDLAALHLSKRQVIEIPNPLLDGQDPLNQPSTSYRP
jgi:hypothetical protein